MSDNFYTKLLPAEFLACKTVGSAEVENKLENVIRTLAFLDTPAFIGLTFLSDQFFRDPAMRFPPTLLRHTDQFIASWHRFVAECRNREDRPSVEELRFFETSSLFSRFVINNLVFHCAQPDMISVFLRQQLEFDQTRN